MTIHTTVEPFGERCPEDEAMRGWLEDSGVYVSVATVDEDDEDDAPLDA